VPEALAVGFPKPADVEVEDRGVEVTALPPTALDVTPLLAAVGIVGSLGGLPAQAADVIATSANGRRNFISLPSKEKTPALSLERGLFWLSDEA
jgi:hypothetical protein